MIVWVLWEDQLAEASRNFGPHTLLLSCIMDDHVGRFERTFLAQRVRANPKKGANNILDALKRNLRQLLDDGSVCAVFDRDKAHRMWGRDNQPARCRAALLEKIKSEAKGTYEIVFLEQNLETLVMACCRALGQDPAETKPNPGKRDQILQNLAFRPNQESRAQVRAEVPSFDRLVRKVGQWVAGP